jgi:class 3 adenylate cyclase
MVHLRTEERGALQVAEIVILNGICAGTVFVLPEIPTVVGRSPESHLKITDPWISSMHAMFERRGSELWIVDLDSRNGTFVGEERVTEARVPDGGVVRFGKTEVRVATKRSGTDETELALEEAARAEHEPREMDATLSTRNPLVRKPEADPYALAPRPATVLRMSIDADGIDELPDAPERLRAAVDAASRAAIEAGGVVARLAGVGVLALFGLTGPDPEDSARALAAARSARRAVRSKGGLDVRAAVDAGPVLAGNAAAANGFELAALGPTAERVERLLASARRGEILAGPGAARVEGLVRLGLKPIGGAKVEVFRDEGE